MFQRRGRHSVVSIPSVFIAPPRNPSFTSSEYESVTWDNTSAQLRGKWGSRIPDLGFIEKQPQNITPPTLEDFPPLPIT